MGGPQLAFCRLQTVGVFLRCAFAYAWAKVESMCSAILSLASSVGSRSFDGHAICLFGLTVRLVGMSEPAVMDEERCFYVRAVHLEPYQSPYCILLETIQSEGKRALQLLSYLYVPIQPRIYFL